jgi:methyl-accepting chemotaxis protein
MSSHDMLKLAQAKALYVSYDVTYVSSFFYLEEYMRKLTAAIQMILILLFAGIFFFQPVIKIFHILLFLLAMLIITGITYFTSVSAEKRLKDDLLKLSNELSVASSRISSVSKEIGITIGENNVFSEEIFTQTQEMSDLTAAVDRNIGETIESIKDMIGYSEETRSATLKMDTVGIASNEVIQNSMGEILNIVDTINEIKVTSNKADVDIQALKSTSDEILNIIDSINDISKQMHIISINASVEASRAGLYGKSFSVVAKEFQSLSSLTDQSIKNISSLIYKIQGEIHEVYKAIKENSDRVDHGVRFTKVVEQNLRNISQSFSDVLQNVSRIGCLSEKESMLAAEMEVKIDRVEELVSMTNGSVSKLNTSASHQKRCVQNIADMGLKLSGAAKELDHLAGTGNGGQKELDIPEKTACHAFFSVTEQEICTNSESLLRDSAFRHRLLKSFIERHQLVEAAWINDINGRFLCSIPEAGIQNANVRDWFNAGIQGERYISSIYVSGITKNECVTLSLPFFNKSGAIRGVVGIDLNLRLLKDSVKHKA